MISYYFGLCGCGKTTILAKIALQESKLIDKHKSRFKCILSNVPLNIPHCYFIPFDLVGVYDFADTLILVDEGSVECDSRDWKNIRKSLVDWMMLHRHYNCDMCFFSQTYNGVDKKIRMLCERVFYVQKRGLFGRWVTKYYRIPYGIIIPNPKESHDKLGEIIEGYARPPFLARLFCPRVFRPFYYKYFDSFIRPLDLKPFEELAREKKWEELYDVDLAPAE